MSDDFFKTGYDYKSVSNLVLNVDSRSRGEIGPSSEVQSLAGRQSVHQMQREMGSRAAQPHADSIKSTKDKQRTRSADGNGASRPKRPKTSPEGPASSFSSSPAPTSLSSSQLYRPQTKETRLVYDSLLSFLPTLLPTLSSHDVLTSAADEVLLILKHPTSTAKSQQAEVNGLLGLKVSDDQFRTLVNIAKRITDWTAGPIKDEESGGKREGRDGGGKTGEAEGEVDDRVGVSVVFNEDDEEEEGAGEEDENVDVIKDEESDVSEVDDRIEDEDTDVTAAVLHSKDGAIAKAEETVEDDDDVVASASTAKAPPSSTPSFDVRAIDAHWIQRQITAFTPDAITSQSLSSRVFTSMSDTQLSDGAVETSLVSLLGFDHFSLIKTLVTHRWSIVFSIRLARAGSDTERADIIREMKENDKAKGVLQQLGKIPTPLPIPMDTDTTPQAPSLSSKSTARHTDAYWVKHPRSMLELDSLAFTAGAHQMSNAECKLPKGSEIFTKKNHQEVHIPALKPQPMGEKERIVKVDEMPQWAQGAFAGMKELNRIQSRVFDTAFNSIDNMLVCAPTGAGKTNVAMLCILREIGAYRGVDGVVQLDKFKVVYIAPMKSLVQEMVLNFGKRLSSYGMKVAELSGDQQLSREQIEQTHVIITTPEKWDIITRKAGDRAYIQLVKLLIIDEIHLLHDDRGPVLESIVTRTIRQIETEQEMVRLVGLSATLPNYEDVAMFLRVNPAKGLFYFDNSYRPVPLQQCYVGITQKKAFKRMQMMNDICYEKVMLAAGKQQQVIVFVHSRKDTATTARMIRDKAQEADELIRFIRDEDTGRKEILKVETENVQSEALKDLLPHGFGIHHAGMTRKDRTLVEELFAAGHLAVLVSTATLAWGVNLPAHTVIIKGTQIYSPEKGEWQELSHLDVMQMLGRAGRPQYDHAGEGIIITSHKELQYYLSLFNQQLPVESQLISTLPDQLNAEIVAGSVTSLKDAVEWLGYSYLYVRMLRRPLLYGVSVDQVNADPYLEQRRVDLVHTAASLLDKHQLIRYDRKTALFSSTDLGRVASHYYLSYHSIAVYNDHLKANLSDIELFRLFSLSYEFKHLAVREEEKVELSKLADKIPIPIKESLDERSAKVNVLLQSYISRLSLEGFALMADLVYITQSAGRITRALFEIVLRRGWSAVAMKLLTLAKMVERQCWEAQSPLRQFPHLPLDQVKRLEGKDLTFTQLLDLEAPALGELLRNQKLGVSFYKAIHYLPHLELSGHVQPITRTTLRLELTITPDFSWLDRYHGHAEAFWVFVEDVDGEVLLHYEFFLLRKAYAQEDHTLHFTVPIFDPLPPQYFIRVVSDRWLGCDISLPISFRRLLLPEKFSPPTELLDLQPLTPIDLASERFISFFDSRVRTFNPIQTQVFHAVYRRNENVLVSAPMASGKTNVIAELAILHSLSEQPDGRMLYVSPLPILAEEREREWKDRFRHYNVKVARLTGDVTVDVKVLGDAQLIVATPREWENLTRRWKSRAAIKDGLSLCIFDDLHLIGGEDGYQLEVAVSRTRYIQTQLSHKRLRLVGLSASIANAKDVGEWMGCSSSSIFNFHPNVRPLPLEIRIHSLDLLDFHARQLAMVKPAFRYLQSQSQGQPTLMFTSDPKHTKQLALALTSLVAASDDNQQLIRGDRETLERSMQDIGVTSGALYTCMLHGIGYLALGMNVQHRAAVIRLYREGIIRVIVLDHSLCYGLGEQISAYLVMVMGTQHWNAALHSHTDIPLTTILQMTAYACRPSVDTSSTLILFTPSNKKELYKRFLYQPFPVESHLHHHLADVLIHEIISRRVETVQEAIDYLTWSFLYRRLTLNANYYSMSGTSHQHVSDYLSELIEQTLDDLKEAKMIHVDEEDEQHQLPVSILNLGMIASFYNLHYTTIEIFHRSLQPHSTLKALLDILSSATELDSLYVKEREEELLATLARKLPLAVLSGEYGDAHVKVGVLVQCHLQRDVPVRFMLDVSKILELFPRLMMAMVDVLSSNGWLSPALAVMELSQMVIQAMWNKDSPLKQLPHFTSELIQRSQQMGVQSIPDILDLEDDIRNDLLASLTPQQVQDVARVCNAYPDVELQLNFRTEGGVESGKGDVVKVRTGETVSVMVRLRREGDEEEEGVPIVHSPYYPHVKSEGWWVVVGSVERNELVAIKRMVMGKKEMNVQLECSVTVSGRYEWTVFLMSDSWMGVDQEYKVHMQVEESEKMEVEGEGNEEKAAD